MKTFVQARIAGCLIAAWIGGTFARAAPPPVTDAEVVAAMHRGADFLLKSRKGDNWEEPGRKDFPGKGEAGGLTSLAMYALLHAGDSLQDDPAYHARLNWRSSDMTPSVEWLCKFRPVETYVAGLQASALTLLPKIPNQKPDEGPRAALEACKWYLLSAMSPDGAYSYTLEADVEGAWKAYFPGKTAAARATLDKAVGRAQIYCFGGPELLFQKMKVELIERLKNTKDGRERMKIEVELKEIDAYARTMPPTPDPAKRKFDPIGDLSNGQYGTLGAWALADYGMELPDQYWKVTDHLWRALQQPDGRWPYLTPVAKRSETTDTMAMAGIASLFISQEFVDTELRLVPRPDKNIDAGLAWLVKAYKPTANTYYMYSVERVGLASGLKFFGTTDWYKDGAAFLLKHQGADGSWNMDWGNTVSTSYALLFLARGRNPVAFNKLQYNGPWNARPRDNAYVTRWMSKHLEKPINWQVVNLQVSPEEWMDAPVLLITGSQDPKFTKEDLAKLRAYVDAGGMIFSTADGAKPAFTEAIRRYAGELVDRHYEMRQLPRNHELFSKQMGVDLPNPPPLLGMSNGIREIWIHAPGDIGADWQMRRFAQGKTSFELGAALYFYASGMGSLRSKLQPLAVDVSNAPAPARTIELAQIEYPGNSNPEPGAWQRMAKLARADFKTQVNVSAAAFGKLDPQKYRLAYLTGTTRVTFTEDEAKALKAYLDGGGLLFADAGGGNTDFAESCRELFKKIYPEAPLTPLPPDHAIYAGTMPDGKKMDDVEFRKYGNLRLQRRVTTPALEAVTVNGRAVILFSPWDVGSGFLGTNTWGIVGYSPSASQALGRNILLFAQSRQ
jgi:hypothetical protein